MNVIKCGFILTKIIIYSMIVKMRKLSILVIIFIFFISLVLAAGEYSGDWHRVDLNIENCDIIGEAKLIINYKHAKIKVKKWRWIESNEFKEKLFKGKIRKNNIDIFMQSRGVGYKHILEGMIYDDKIFLTFSSTHTEINEKFGGCKFEFVKD